MAAPAARLQGHRHALARGFTLVEVLVAMFAMTILAALSWQGLDSVLRSREAARVSMDRIVRVSTVLAQWEQDLSGIYATGAVPALEFDGLSLRLTRRNQDGVSLVVWSLRSGAWKRWASPVQTQTADLQDAWLRSQQFLGNEKGQVPVAEGAQEWQVYFHRAGAWTNAQSTGDFATPAGADAASVAAAAAAAIAADAAAIAAAAAAAASAAGTGAGVATAPAASGTVPPTATATATATAQGGVPQASAGPAASGLAGPFQQLPAAVRLVLMVGDKKITRDIALGPE